eukprot:TRINITY_DN16930_c0_g1_i1.p2 TRINITY_DN16930_c0_g1~~TRINITY_DN16930_c0_g1_i1.p2  ORF type:complete len:343 (+),score=92.98 TRINITY_DN16930_c0_g1_i1:39-1067(+)
MQACSERHHQAVSGLSRQWREVCMALPQRLGGAAAAAEHCARLGAAAEAADPQAAPRAAHVALVLKYPPQAALYEDAAALPAAATGRDGDAARPRSGPPVGDADAWKAVLGALEGAGDTGAAQAQRAAPAGGEPRRKRPRRGAAAEEKKNVVAVEKARTDKCTLAALDGVEGVWMWRYTGHAIDVGRAWSTAASWVCDALQNGVALHGRMGHVATREELESSLDGLRRSFQARYNQLHDFSTPRALVAPVEVLAELEAAATIARENPAITDNSMTEMLTHFVTHEVIVLALRRGEDGAWHVTEGWKPGWLPQAPPDESVTGLPPGVECEVRRRDLRWVALQP